MLERLGRAASGEPVAARAMFGGVGLYVGGLFCALIADGRLFFKVDATNRADFERAGMDAFQPFPDRPGTMSYYELPERVLVDDSRLRAWLDKSLDVARRAATKKQKVRKLPTSRTPIAKLENLGPKSAAWLAAVGVKTRADLQRVGSVRAFERVREAGLNSSLNLLWALEACLLGMPWQRLSDEQKRELRARAGLPAPKRPRR